MSGTEPIAGGERRVKEQAVRLLQRMQQKLDAAEARLSAPVAIIGMACRLPLGDTPADFWAALAAGCDGIRPVPPERWAAAETGAVAHGGFLDNVDRFDAEFFGISPREAIAMDPQQRLALEVAWHALEDAGIAADRLDGSPTGVYLGCCTADYARLGDADALSTDGYAATGGAPGVAAGRIAYALGLHGPALVVDTACSSSLVAVHLAMQALRAGECTLALAGGVNLTLLPQGAATLDRLHMLAPDGRCKAFDAAADGFVRGEGCGVVVLKLLSAAARDGDRVLAVIRGSAVGQDGRSAGLTAPSGPAQEAVIRAALANAGMPPEAIDYVEAHGTGTALGDPIEMHALCTVFAGRKRPLWVGSVKSNIGHAEAAAGVAGLVKAVMMLRRQAVPASLHFRALNPHIDLGEVPIAVPTALLPQPELRAIGVSSFGFSGTNAHLVVTCAPDIATRPAAAPAGQPLLLISARTPAALRRLVQRYRTRLEAGADFADVAFSAAVGRARLPWWVCVKSAAELDAAEPSDAPPPELPAEAGRRVALPLYPFERQRYWLADSDIRPGRRLAQAGATTIFEVQLLPGEPLVADHRVRGEALLPAADIVERLLGAVRATGGEALRDIAFERPVAVGVPRTLQVVVEPGGDGLVLFTRDGARWQRAAGAFPAAAEETPPADLAVLRAACGEPIAPAAFAEWLREAGLEYGPLYDCIAELWRGAGQALARLRPAAPVAQLDAALRIAGAIAYGASGAARLPTGLARYQRHADLAGRELWAHADLVEEGAGVTVADIRLIDDDGTVLADLAGLRLAVAPTADEWRQWCHVTEWVEMPSPAAASAAICDRLGDLRPLAAALDAAAAGYAGRALAALDETEIAPQHRWLWHHLPRLAARPASEAVPEGPEGALLARCGEALPAILRGERDPLPLLFADGAAAAIYAQSPVYRAANEIVAALAVAALPPTGRRRVLEIGAGTGGTTTPLLAALDGGDTEYWFTDLSPTLVAEARGRLAAAHFGVFDVEQPPAAQDIPEGAFDLVIAANVLHATRDLAAALRHAAAALAPGGRLLLLESMRAAEAPGSPGSWIDLVFGLTEGWWRFQDHALRPDYPLLPRRAWQELLAAQGFEAECFPQGEARLPGQIVLLARRRVGELVVEDPGGSAAARCAALLAAIQGMPSELRRLVLLTKGAVGPAVTDPAAAALWGIVRTLRLERPELEVRAIDRDDGGWPLGVERLTAEPEIAVAAGRRYVPRLATAPPAAAPLAIDPAGWVLVTGAYGGLGRFAAEWLARRGARHLVLTGRQAPETDWVTALRAAGATIRLEGCDLADPAALDALIGRLPPLSGIVHAAGILDDATLAAAQPEQFAAVLAPKLDAALRLDAAFPDLDFFLLFSSAVALFGQAGQASHVAASTALDALAAARRRHGRHAVSLGWGPWRDIGAAAGREALIARMAQQGLGTIPSDAGAAVLDWALAAPVAAAAVLPIDRARFLAGFAAAQPPAATRSWQAPRGRLRTAAAKSPAVANDGALLVETVAAEAAAVLGYSPGQAIDRGANLFELGLDSLMAVELRNRLQARLPERTLTSTLVFEHSSIAALAAYLAGAAPVAATSPQGEAATNAAIAIIGIGCRFPAGGDDPAAFWQALADGRDGIVPHPDRPDAGMAPGRPRPAGYLPDVAGFDPIFFGIAPREAVLMDPQHRLLLEVAWEALEDALIPPDGLTGTPAGVFVGMCNYDYAALAAAADSGDGYAGTGAAPSIAAGRIAYLLGLTGPALVVDTACSSSLVAVHLAMQALRGGECTLALAGGVNLALGGGTTAALEGLHMLAPDGRCKAFDAAADGFVRGEGCGVVVLKLLSAAVRDGDRVLAVIRGSAVGQDGRSAGLTAPSGPAQEAVIRAALANAGMAPEAIDYVEAHGTGTALGDPIEMHALCSVFRGRERKLWVGSVKSNIGHAEAAAGVAGLVKAVMMLRHQAVPASLHFHRLNPHIDLGEVPIAVPTALLPQPELRAIGVSSFGFSGTNAHLVVTRAPDIATPPAAAPAGQPLLLISARTPAALRRLVQRYRTRLEAGADFADVAFSAAVGRARLPWWVCVKSAAELEAAEPSDAPPPELPAEAGRRVALPLYPFERRRYWATPAAAPSDAAGGDPLLGRRLRSALAVRQFEAVLAAGRPPWLGDHRLGGETVVPAAALVAMLMQAVPPETPAELTDIAFHRMLKPDERPVVQTIADPATRRVTILAAGAGADAPFAEIAGAAWCDPAAFPDGSLAGARAACPRSVDLAELYAAFAAAGLDYGPAFRGLRSLAGGEGVAVAELAESDPAYPPAYPPAYSIDPRVLDAAWQSLAAALPAGSGSALVPVGLDRLVVPCAAPRWSVLRLRTPDRADVTLFDGEGRAVGFCGGLRLAPAAVAAATAVLQEPCWREVAPGDEMPDWLECRNESDAAAACWRVIEAYRRAPEGPAPPRLAILTSRATTVAGRIPSPAQAALTGLVRSLAQERPELRPLLLDLDEGELPPPVAADATDAILASRDGQLFAPRLAPLPLSPAPTAPFVLSRGEAATLDALSWSPRVRRPPGPGEVEIEVAAAGINFRDLMNLLGVYPGDGGAPGAECAGTIATLGPGVTELSVGEAVVAIAPGSFASHVVADARLVCPVPPQLDWQAVAGQPVALLTARLALDDIVRLAPGQRVLIHAATGGVGLAAVALARARGAAIVATAGSAAKRDHLAALGIGETYDSRSLDFARAAPVDVVLNSLTGEAIPAGLRLLKPGGLFLELGKAEIWPPRRVAELRPDVRYVAVALDRLILDAPERVGAMLRDAIDALAHGSQTMLPIRSYPFGSIGEALRRMQAARHIGKLVLARTRLRGDASYVISGGTGALGRHLARWLVERGARHLLLLARHAVPVEIPGAEVSVAALDIADEVAVRRALAALRRPLKGVFHLAGELHDATAANLTRAQLDAALAPKLGGAQVLDRATAGCDLDLFVLFSSLAAVTGAAGQANYAAANAALDALAQARRGRGLPALAVDWGAWQGEGMAAGRAGPALPPSLALNALDAALSSGIVQVAISMGAAAAPATAAPLIDLDSRLADAVGSAKLDILAAAVDEAIVPILGLGELALERERPLAELGLDSLMAVELRNALGRLTRRVLPTSLVFDHPSAVALTAFLAGELGLAAASPSRPPPVLSSVMAALPIEDDPVEDDPVENDDEDTLLALLERKLTHAGF